MFEALQLAWETSPVACGQVMQQHLSKLKKPVMEKIQQIINTPRAKHPDSVAELLLEETLLGVHAPCSSLEYDWRCIDGRTVSVYMHNPTQFYDKFETPIYVSNLAVWAAVRRLNAFERRRLMQQIDNTIEHWIRHQAKQFVSDLTRHQRLCHYLQTHNPTFHICHTAEYKQEPTFRQHQMVSSCPFVYCKDTQKGFLTNAIKTLCERGESHVLASSKPKYSNDPDSWRYIHKLDMYDWHDAPKSLIIDTDTMQLARKERY